MSNSNSKSRSLSIGIIAEGPTDHIVIQEILRNLMKDKQDFTIHPIQPEVSEVFEQIQGPTGTGWSGVFRQIEIIQKHGLFHLEKNSFLMMFDLLIVHLDGDVSRETYSKGRLSHVDKNDLPCKVLRCPLGKQKIRKQCEENCTLVREKMDGLRQVIMGWMQLKTIPNNIVLCTPSDNSEAWVLAALYPENKLVRSGKLECRESPERELKSRHRLEKTVQDYLKHVRDKLHEYWPNARMYCSEAERFSNEILRNV